MSDDPIAEDWLRSVGFKWYQLDSEPSKHWLLWLEADDGPAFEDLGLELAKGYGDWWFCWLRSDTAHRYSRFLHVRHLRRQSEVISLVEALTGRSWDPTSHIFGCVRTPAKAARYRAESDRPA